MSWCRQGAFPMGDLFPRGPEQGQQIPSTCAFLVILIPQTYTFVSQIIYYATKLTQIPQ